MPGKKKAVHSQNRKLKPNLTLVRDWIYSIINPMVADLGIEEEQVKNKKWTWRCHSRQFEYLKYTSEMIGEYLSPNFDQFKRFNPETKKCIKDHDDKLKILGERVGKYYDYLVILPKYIEEINKIFSLLTKEENDDPSQKPEILNLFAQYIVNNAGELPSLYSRYKTWNLHKDKLAALKERSGILEHVEEVDSAGEDFMKSIISLEKILDKKRTNWADQFKIPVVPSNSLYPVPLSEDSF